MCGIVGYVGKRAALDILVQGLRTLEYRGYDSAGVAFFSGKALEVVKAQGKLESVERLLKSVRGREAITCGIGHTRWATHGKPTTTNAHPHRTGHVALVHNGIIENYQELRRELLERGHRPNSETDSELFGFLVLEEMNEGLDLATAVRKSFGKIKGACSVVVVSEREPGVLVAVRNGSPLVAAGDPDGGLMLASDAQPLLCLTRQVIYLEHGDVVVGDNHGFKILDLETGAELERSATLLDWSLEKLDKRGFDHYMLKEIHEQPTAVVETLKGLLNPGERDPFAFLELPAVRLLERADEIKLIACGTSWHAALLGKYWLERWAGLPVDVELASEYRYRKPVQRPRTVVVGISQSGETADTLAVIRQAKEARLPTIGISNVRGSTLSREADAALFTCAGPEIGVAATKTFSSQLALLISLAGHLGRRQGGEAEKEITSLYDGFIRVPHLLSGFLESDSGMSVSIDAAAKALMRITGFFFIGRGYSYPIALEGALKLKEIAYVHSEGYAAGELKHGPIAMIDEDMAVIVLAPKDPWRDKTVSNLEEVKARGAVVVGVGNHTDEMLRSLCDHWIPLPPELEGRHESLLPFFLTPVVQLLSYRLAALRGTDIDKPRNLAKSVTVE